MAFGLNTLTDVFTGDPQKQAAEDSRNYLAQQAAETAARIKAAQEQGIGALTSGQTQAVGAVGSGIGQARADISGSLDPALAAISGGTGQAAGALTAGQTGGLAELRSGVAGAKGAFDPLAAAAGRYGAAGGQASQASADALGLNGPEGYARAISQFKTGPGYDFSVNQGIDALTRAANVGGMVASGNTLREAQTFGQGLANQEFGNWRDALAKREGLYVPAESGALSTVGQGRATADLTGGTGGANIYTGTAGRLSDLYSGAGRGAADIYTTGGRSLADLASKGGLTSASIYQTGGQNIADLISGLTKTQVGYTQNQLDDYTRTYRDEAAAAAGGSANLWGAIGGAAELAAGGGFIPSGSFTPFGKSAPKKG